MEPTSSVRSIMEEYPRALRTYMATLRLLRLHDSVVHSSGGKAQLSDQYARSRFRGDFSLERYVPPVKPIFKFEFRQSLLIYPDGRS